MFSATDPKARVAYLKKCAALKAKLNAAREAYQEAVQSLPVAEDGRQYRRERLIQDIILQLESLGDLMPGDFAHNLGLSRSSIHRALRQAVERGLVKANGYGLYTLPEGHIRSTEAEGVKAFNRKVLGADFAEVYPKKPTKRPPNRKKLPGRK